MIWVVNLPVQNNLSPLANTCKHSEYHEYTEVRWMSSEYQAHNFEYNFFTRSGLLQITRQKIMDCKIGPRNEKKIGSFTWAVLYIEKWP